MAKRGRKPTPTPVLKLRGSYRNDRHGGRLKDSNLDQSRPACPKRLITKRKTDDGEAVRRVAKTTWDRLVPMLHDAGLMTNKDREMMEMLCDSFGRWVLACHKVDTEGATAAGSSGNEVRSPWISIRDNTFGQVTKLAACFGLSPADIANVRAVERPPTDDSKTRFFIAR